jgi:hypothetical protein
VDPTTCLHFLSIGETDLIWIGIYSQVSSNYVILDMSKYGGIYAVFTDPHLRYPVPGNVHISATCASLCDEGGRKVWLN